jgi:hypothetical protein
MGKRGVELGFHFGAENGEIILCRHLLLELHLESRQGLRPASN